jgi:hypothetical protein
MKKLVRIHKTLLLEGVINLALYTVLISKANVKKAMVEDKKLARAYDTHMEA